MVLFTLNSYNKMKNSCHVCLSKKIKLLKNLSSLRLITSDCQSWDCKNIYYNCLECGVVGTLMTKKWARNCTRIYKNYNIYHQSDSHSEQKVFCEKTKKMISRSDLILQILKKLKFIKKSNKIKACEIGAGGGFFVKKLKKYLSKDNIFAFEKSKNNIRKLQKILNKANVCLSFGQKKIKFDRVILIHTFEHIAQPSLFLNTVAQNLEKSGKLFIQVPNSESNPYLLCIADHSVHYTKETLQETLRSANFKCEKIQYSFGKKEISAIFKYYPNLKEVKNVKLSTMSWVDRHFRKISHTKSFFQHLKRKVYLFGSSLGATWILAKFPHKIISLVDEDKARIGKKFFGKKIISLNQVPANSLLFSSVKPTKYNQIRSKIKNKNCNLVT